MTILDIDIDYFLKEIPKECDSGRLHENEIERWRDRKIWDEKRKRKFNSF